MVQSAELTAAPTASTSVEVKPASSSDTVQEGQAWSIEKCLAEVNTPVGLAKLKAVLAKRPFPHFEEAPGHPDCYLRIDEDGARTVGQFVGREFIAMDKL